MESCIIKSPLGFTKITGDIDGGTGNQIQIYREGYWPEQ